MTTTLIAAYISIIALGAMLGALAAYLNDE